ncbi:hypothetical protein PoB_002458500 [Plakobranchus ocellatus]|uniref:Uncharacterized protein n=1 Tax=Plakobranchus ocellatus TaxID=259542 RepID=A0AAV3ZTW9_9GAST|nr:hypothetical protein PoB_002458500 [Plakobranchus ocellatus]
MLAGNMWSTRLVILFVSCCIANEGNRKHAQVGGTVNIKAPLMNYPGAVNVTLKRRDNLRPPRYKILFTPPQPPHDFVTVMIYVGSMKDFTAYNVMVQSGKDTKSALFFSLVDKSVKGGDKRSKDLVYQKNDEDIMDRKKSNELVLKEAYIER